MATGLMTSPQTGFDDLVKRWRLPIYRYALRRLGNDADASDVTQDVFLTVYGQLHTLRSPAAFQAWLYRIASNAIKRAVKRAEQRRQAEQQARSAEAPGSLDLEQREREALVRDALRGLPEELQTVLTLHYFEGLSQRAIGEVLECPRSTVQSKLDRGLASLKKVLPGGGALAAAPVTELLRPTSVDHLPKALAQRLERLSENLTASGKAVGAAQGALTMSFKTLSIALTMAGVGFMTGLVVSPSLDSEIPDKRVAQRAGPLPVESQEAKALARAQANLESSGKKVAALEESLSTLRKELEQARQGGLGAGEAEARKSSLATSKSLNGAAIIRQWAQQRAAPAAAIGCLKTIFSSQTIYFHRYQGEDGRKRYAPSLRELGDKNLIDSVLASGEKGTYRFEMGVLADSAKFWVRGIPQNGRVYLYGNEGGIVYESTKVMSPRSNSDSRPDHGRILKRLDYVSYRSLENSPRLVALLQRPDEFAAGIDALLGGPNKVAAVTVFTDMKRAMIDAFPEARRRFEERFFHWAMREPSVELKLRMLSLVEFHDSALKAKATPELIALTESTEVPIRVAAFLSLAKINTLETTRFFMDLAEQTERSKVVESVLVDIPGNRHFDRAELLFKLRKSRFPSVRWRAYQNMVKLERLSLEQCLTLVDELREGEPQHRRDILTTLGNCGQSDCVDELQRALDDGVFKGRDRLEVEMTVARLKLRAKR